MLLLLGLALLLRAPVYAHPEPHPKTLVGVWPLRLRGQRARVQRAVAAKRRSLVTTNTPPHPPHTQFPTGSRVRVLLARNVTVTPNTTTITSNGQKVEVSVRGVDGPLSNDLLAVYAPPTMDPTKTVPLTWSTIAQASPDYVKTGSGAVT